MIILVLRNILFSIVQPYEVIRDRNSFQLLTDIKKTSSIWGETTGSLRKHKWLRYMKKKNIHLNCGWRDERVVICLKEMTSIWNQVRNLKLVSMSLDSALVRKSFNKKLHKPFEWAGSRLAKPASSNIFPYFVLFGCKGEIMKRPRDEKKR